MLHNKIDPETFAKDIPPTYVQKSFELEDLDPSRTLKMIYGLLKNTLLYFLKRKK